MRNPKDLSAVERLEFSLLGIISFDSEELRAKYKERIQQAKQIFKQQVIEAGNTCAFKQSIHSRKVDLMSLEELEQYAKEEAINVGQEYYNETFLKKT